MIWLSDKSTSAGHARPADSQESRHRSRTTAIVSQLRIHQLSDDVLRVEEGSLYPALYRMEEQGLIQSEWRTTENNRKAKFYKLTRKGRTAADAELPGLVALVAGRQQGAPRD